MSAKITKMIQRSACVPKKRVHEHVWRFVALPLVFNAFIFQQLILVCVHWSFS